MFLRNSAYLQKNRTLVYNQMQMIKSNLFMFINFTRKKGDRGVSAVKIRNQTQYAHFNELESNI